MNDHSPNNKWIGKRTIRPDGMDKVTGRATFGADHKSPGMLWGKILRSPHPHAQIKSINTVKAAALPGVKAVMTSQDMVEFPWDKAAPLGIQDLRYISRNVLARERVLYVGRGGGRSCTLTQGCDRSLEVD
jgi:CO/xanthine dehydrogenase Mo-binding subunit